MKYVLVASELGLGVMLVEGSGLVRFFGFVDGLDKGEVEKLCLDIGFERLEGKVGMLRVSWGYGLEREIWEELSRVRGTIAYGKLGERLGNRKLARVIGSVMARNRVAFFKPCHRVVCSDGDLGEYRWGRWRKARMIAMEIRS